jgi:hypothetical protein
VREPRYLERGGAYIHIRQFLRKYRTREWHFRKDVYMYEREKGDPILCRDGNNSNVGSVFTPHNGSLMKAVELRNGEGRVLLLLRDTVLGAECISSPYMSL